MRVLLNISVKTTVRRTEVIPVDTWAHVESPNPPTFTERAIDLTNSQTEFLNHPLPLKH